MLVNVTDSEIAENCVVGAVRIYHVSCNNNMWLLCNHCGRGLCESRRSFCIKLHNS